MKIKSLTRVRRRRALSPSRSSFSESPRVFVHRYAYAQATSSVSSLMAASASFISWCYLHPRTYIADALRVRVSRRPRRLSPLLGTRASNRYRSSIYRRYVSPTKRIKRSLGVYVQSTRPFITWHSDTPMTIGMNLTNNQRQAGYMGNTNRCRLRLDSQSLAITRAICHRS